MKTTFSNILILYLLFLYSCSEDSQKKLNTHSIKIIETQGHLVPKDSIASPKVTLIEESKLKKSTFDSKKIVLANNNVSIAGPPKIVLTGIPRICTPGLDSFALPKIILVTDSSFMAGIPEVVIAKDPTIKDQNPQNFSSFKKLQGLRHNDITSLLEDKKGNLWFFTAGGGITKYDGKFFTNFTEKEGLSSNLVMAALEDKKGNLWFATGAGVIKYDGRYFIHYTEKNGLTNNFIRCLLEDKSGNIWFGSNLGLTKYDGKSFTNYTDNEGLSNNIVRSILQDKKGNLWIGTQGGGVNKYDGKSFTHYTDQEGLSNNIVREILEDKKGNIWFGTYGGACKFDGKHFTNYTEKEGLSNNIVLSMCEDKLGNLWLGTDGGGANKFDGASFTYFSENEGLPSTLIWKILEDKRGNLWFATFGSGVSKYNGNIFTHFTEREGLPNNVVASIIEAKNGNMFFGTLFGVNEYDGKSFHSFWENNGLAVKSLLEDKKGNLWIGTFDGIIKYDGTSIIKFTKNEGLSDNGVTSMAEDKNGDLWFGTHNGLNKYNGKSFTCFRKKEGLSHDNIYSILIDKQGCLWIGTGGGVTKYDGKSFAHFGEKEGLLNKVVLCIAQDKKENLWFGTFGGGVSKYDGRYFTTFTEKNGLTNNLVGSILEDSGGNIWFGTRFGLSKLSRSKFIELSEKILSNTIKENDVFFKNYTYEDGFLGIGLNGGKNICEARDGTLWIGSNDRLTAYHPQGDNEDSIPPNIQITSLELFNENIAWGKLLHKEDTTLTLGNGVNVSKCKFDSTSKWYGLPANLSLAHNNNYLTFNFIGITMSQPKKVKYQYKLQGIDENWSALTDRTDAAYGNLPQGKYTFKVKAMSGTGYWSNEFIYTFTIRPPWWQTWWFRSLIALLIVGLIVFYIKWRERKLKAEKEILEHTVKVRTAEVVEQKHIIEEKHKEITDSINYAERIQRSFIATKEILDENLSDYFVLFKPKDVVSGDFYWASKLNNGNFAFVTADSTGHGVPGAIMSLLNITSLEKAIETLTQPSDILNSTRKSIIERLKKDGSQYGGKDGMDASLTIYDFNKKKLFTAAANNPIWIVRGNETIEIKADKMPIGKHDRDNISFTQQEIDLQIGDVVYTLTDGFPDQFGGEKGKKFMSKNLRELLLANSYLPMYQQKELLEKTFADWVGNLEQVDDVTLIGVRV